MVVTSGVAGLSDRHAQGSGVQRHLGDEGRAAAAGGLDRTSQGLAVTDQLIENRCPTWDLSDRPGKDGGRDVIDIHLQKEVAEGGIGGITLELNAKDTGQHGVVASGKKLQIAQSLTRAQDPEHCHQQQVLSRDAYTPSQSVLRSLSSVKKQSLCQLICTFFSGLHKLISYDQNA